MNRVMNQAAYDVILTHIPQIKTEYFDIKLWGANFL